MSIDITQYMVIRVDSKRTHANKIDIQIGDVRSFIDDEIAMELIKKIFKALATPYVKEPVNSVPEIPGEV